MINNCCFFLYWAFIINIGGQLLLYATTDGTTQCEYEEKLNMRGISQDGILNIHMRMLANIKKKTVAINTATICMRVPTVNLEAQLSP